jgi:hypothetical protein
LTSTYQLWFYPVVRGIEMAGSSNKSYINTTLNTGLLRSLKILAAQKGMRLNQLLEEALQDLLKKYEVRESNPPETRRP